MSRITVPQATSRRRCLLLSTFAHQHGLAFSSRSHGAEDHNPPSHISKMVLSTVHVGGLELIEGRTIFEMRMGL